MAQLNLSKAGSRCDELFGEIKAPIASIVIEQADKVEADSIARKIFKERKSTSSMEAYGSVTGIDSFTVVGENGAYPTGGFESGYFQTIINQTWKGSFGISWEAMQDIKIMDLKQKPTKFFADYNRTFEGFFAQLLGAAIKGDTAVTINGITFPVTSADKVCMFSKAHPPKVKGTNQSNLYADPFSLDALGSMATMMQNVRDDSGNIMNLVPDTIIVPNMFTLKKLVFEAIASASNPDNANGAVNPLCGNFGVFVWPELTQYVNGQPWILMDSSFNDDFECAVFQNRWDLEIYDEVGANDEYLWKGRSRFSGGFVDFRGMFVGGVAGGSSLPGLTV